MAYNQLSNISLNDEKVCFGKNDEQLMNYFNKNLLFFNIKCSSFECSKL